MYRAFFIICNSTNGTTVTVNKYIKFIRLLHVSIPNVSSSGILFCYLAKLPKYNCLEDDTFFVETFRSLIMFVYLFILIVLSLVELQIKMRN